MVPSKIINKSVSDLSEKMPRMWEWLSQKADSKKAKANLSKSQFRKDFQDLHLGMAFSRIKEILEYSHRLSSKKLEEIYNAGTLQGFLEPILKDHSKQFPEKNYKHDFKTTELARLMFEVSSEYLQDATKSKTVRDDLARVSDHFLVQSESKIESEQYAKHGNDKDVSLTRSKEIELKKN